MMQFRAIDARSWHGPSRDLREMRRKCAVLRETSKTGQFFAEKRLFLRGTKWAQDAFSPKERDLRDFSSCRLRNHL
jgi:hypothetical protein